MVFFAQLAKPEAIERFGAGVKGYVLMYGHSRDTQTGAFRDNSAVSEAEFLPCNTYQANCWKKRLVASSYRAKREKRRHSEI